MLLLDPTAPEERRTAAISEAESMINSGGELVTSQDWGTRRMAYEIDHRPEADYRLYQFEGDNALLDRLNHSLKITDGVLRFRIIKLRPGTTAARRQSKRIPAFQRLASNVAISLRRVRGLYSGRSECDDQPQQSGYGKGIALILVPLSGGFVLSTC
jgi:small subunit ribosomal protein S6